MTKIFNSIVDLEIELKEVRGNCEIIAFVPTMGALHQGHLQLVKEAQKIADKVVMSIFVNPTQFNDKNDLDKYPKTLDADIKLVQTVGLDYLYVPDETEIYPPEKIVELELNLLHYDQVMEGAFRPGHFKGVCQVV
ncbi:MAG TPA: pantoate--beta-alanine ligase, partial [Saprospiraceae bacterium]|nr:pantoate--beta-alanine ligase [Saprospiraceae bacterium]